MPDDRGPAPVTVTAATLTEKLDDMTLHDETGDPRDEGYMAAVRELRDWIAERAAGPPGRRTGSRRGGPREPSGSTQ
jgi:hypothetical protein